MTAASGMATNKAHKPQAKGVLGTARCCGCNCTPLLHRGRQGSAHARTRAPAHTHACPNARPERRRDAPSTQKWSAQTMYAQNHIAHASKSLGCFLPQYAQRLLLTFSEMPRQTLLCNYCTARRSTNIGGKPQWEPLRSSANRDARHGKLNSPAWAFARAHDHPLGAGIPSATLRRRTRQGHLARLRTAASR